MVAGADSAPDEVQRGAACASSSRSAETQTIRLVDARRSQQSIRMAAPHLGKRAVERLASPRRRRTQTPAAIQRQGKKGDHDGPQPARARLGIARLARL